LVKNWWLQFIPMDRVVQGTLTLIGRGTEPKPQRQRIRFNEVDRMIGKLGFLGFFTLGVAIGQAPVASQAIQHTGASVSAKPVAFEVVSIRQNVSGVYAQTVGPTADGYRMINLPMAVPLITAYLPQIGSATVFTADYIKGMPDWVTKDHFDIDAKMSAEDLSEWQKPSSQPGMLRAMLQALLVDRCKIAVHREVKETAVYSIVVGKNGPKFKPTNPEEKHEGMKFPFGGIVRGGNGTIELYAAPMSSLAAMLSSMGPHGVTGRQVQDKTGLTGLYDFIIPKPQATEGQPGEGNGTTASDPGGVPAGLLDSLGLKLVAGKAPVETLVIDHIERPSAN
jgi:uncharacterized protein (TIGR03435 family)